MAERGVGLRNRDGRQQDDSGLDLPWTCPRRGGGAVPGRPAHSSLLSCPHQAYAWPRAPYLWASGF